jgi:hypothetical protein
MAPLPPAAAFPNQDRGPSDWDTFLRDQGVVPPPGASALAVRIHEWATSPDGQRALADALAEGKAEARRLETVQRVRPEDLRIPMAF